MEFDSRTISQKKNDSRSRQFAVSPNFRNKKAIIKKIPEKKIHRIAGNRCFHEIVPFGEYNLKELIFSVNCRLTCYAPNVKILFSYKFDTQGFNISSFFFTIRNLLKNKKQIVSSG